MKRRLFSFLMVVMIVCLAASMVVLSACDKTDPPAPEPDYSSDTTTMFKEVVQKLQASYVVGNKFGVDVDAHFAIDDKTEKNDDVKFALTAKGNADLANTQDASATNFFIELAMHKGEEKTTLLGIAYEVIENEPFFFVSVAGSEYIKLNGYSLTALYAAATGTAQSSAEIFGFDVQEIISWVMPILFGEKGTVKDGVYTFDFDLANVMKSLNEASGMIFSLLESQAGITKEQVNGVIAQVFGNLEYTVGTKTYKVKDLNSLTEYVKREMSFAGTLAFAFDANGKFDSANISFDYAQKNTPVANYTFAVNKAKVGIDTVGVDTFANFTLTADQRKNNEAINALNFSLLGTATGFNADGEVAHNYTIEVQSDINPFALLSLVGNTSKENIVATLKKLGYFHLEINEVYEDETKAPLNIITLHSNFEEGFAVANVHAYKAVLYNVGIGGVYDFDALVDVIDMLVNKPSDPGEDPEPVEPKPLIDRIKDAIDTVKEYLAFFNADNMAENGVDVELKNLVFHLIESLGMQLDGTLQLGVGAIVGSDTMNIKLQTPTYNTCDEKIATDTLVGNIRNAYKTGKTDLIKQIVSVDGLSLKAYKGAENINFYSSDANLDLNKAFKITGINLKGEEVVSSGYIMGVKGLDLNTVGTQNVTLYVAVANDLSDLARAGLAIGDDIPLAGALKFETQIEVLDPENAEITIPSIKDNVTILYSDKVFDKIKGAKYGYFNCIKIGESYLPITEDNMVVFDKDGNKVELVDGKISVGGQYTVKFVANGITSPTVTVNVESIVARRSDGNEEVEQLVLGETWNFDPYEIYVVTKDGETKQSVTAKYTIGNVSNGTIDKVFDITQDANGKDVYTLKKNLSFAGKDLQIYFSGITAGGKKTNSYTVKIPVVAKEGIKVSKSVYSNYCGQTLSGGFEITINDVVYSLKWNGTSFEAIAEDGTKLDNLTVSLTWETRKVAVELNANGVVTNPANKNIAGARAENILFDITYGEYSATYTVKFNELSANNKSTHQIAKTLDSAISNVAFIPYYNEDGEKKTLSFKYGADGYGIYAGDIKVYDVTVTVANEAGENVELVEGKFTATGKYNVTYSMTIDGVNQTFTHSVTVK